MKKRKIDPLEEIMSNPYYQLRDEYNDAEKIKWTMADIMVKILMKGAKAIGKTAVILIIWTAHKLENK